VDRSPDRATGSDHPTLWPGLRTGPPARTEGLHVCAVAETFGRGPWRGPETPPQRGATGSDRRSPRLCKSGDLRSRTVAGSGDPATTACPWSAARI